MVGVASVVSFAFASACGGSSSNPGNETPSGGRGGSGGATGRAGSAGSAGKTAMAGAPGALKCGSAMCKAVTLPIGDFTIPPCCADEAASQCGLDSSVLATFGPTFPVACQPLNQPGTEDSSCPNSAKTPVTGSTLEIQFAGCCRDNGTCGYMLDKLGGIFQLGLGCVDSSPFVDGGTPSLCGGGGEGGAGGGGESVGGASQAGASHGGSSGAIEPGAAGEGGSAGT